MIRLIILLVVAVFVCQALKPLSEHDEGVNETELISWEQAFEEAWDNMTKVFGNESFFGNETFNETHYENLVSVIEDPPDGWDPSTDAGNETAPLLLVSPQVDPFGNASAMYIHGVEGKNITRPEHHDDDARGMSLAANSLPKDVLAMVPKNWLQKSRNGQLMVMVPDSAGSTFNFGGNQQRPPAVKLPPQPPPQMPSQFTPDVSGLPRGACGQTTHDPMPDARIVGGKEATKGSIPWLVRLEMYAGPGVISLCGGTLLRVSDRAEESDIVLTAAHCYDPKDGMKIPGSKVIAGNHNRRQNTREAQKVAVSRFISHEQYNLDRFKKNDIAIIKLAQPIKFGENVQPICLPQPNERVREGTAALAAGWGNTAENGQQAMGLMEVIVPIVSFQTCNNAFRNIIDQTQICAGYTSGGKDTCQGDSGGPLLVPSRQGYVIQGVVSVGKGCARSGYPGIYTRVSGFRDWIDTQIRQHSDVARQAG